MKRSYSASCETGSCPGEKSFPPFALRAHTKLAYTKASAPGSSRAGSGGACFRSWTASVTAAATITSASVMGKARLIRMQCGQMWNDSIVELGVSAWTELHGPLRYRHGVHPDVAG